MALSSFRLRPVGYGFFLFVLAAMNLCSLMSNRIAGISSNFDGYQFFDSFNITTANWSACNGFWSCNDVICNLAQHHQMFAIIPNTRKGEQCGAHGWSWLVRWDNTRSAIIILIVSLCLEVLGSVFGLCRVCIDKINRHRICFWTILGLRILSRVGLITAYCLFYDWSFDQEILSGDHLPGFLQGWSIAMSSVFILVNLWALIPEPVIQNGYTIIN